MVDFNNRGGSLPEDTSRRPIQVGQSMLFEDGHATPKESPLTVSSPAIEITIPEQASAMIVTAAGADLRIGNADPASNPYYLLTDTSTIPLHIAGRDSVYFLKDDSTNVTVNFYFIMQNTAADRA